MKIPRTAPEKILQTELNLYPAFNFFTLKSSPNKDSNIEKEASRSARLSNFQSYILPCLEIHRMIKSFPLLTGWIDSIYVPAGFSPT